MKKGERHHNSRLLCGKGGSTLPQSHKSCCSIDNILSGGERTVRRLSFSIAVLMCLMTVSAFAQATRTWVSGVGDDVNPCSRTAPCKTWAGAISKTASGGIIDALDPGGFGALTITKAMTINGDATIASVLNSSVNGIVVNAGPSDIITLRHIS